MKIQLKISDGIIIDKYIEEFSEYEIADGIYYLSSEKTEFVQSENIVEVCKRNKGIAIRTYENSLEVYNDPFCSVPVYIYKNENEIYITSQFDELLEKKLSVDRVGVYETFLFEAPLHDRTNFNEVKQLPAASFVNIDMKSLDLTISGYWDFSIKENTDITCKEDAIEAVWNVLCDEFSDYKGKELVMGISGGLDSRLSLCVLNEVAGLERIETFTFGHNKNILDYKLAKQVCAFTGCRKLTNLVIGTEDTEIGTGTFYGCESLTEIVIPEGIRVIGMSAFSDCVSLTSVSLPSTLETIDSAAFLGCAKIARMELPSSVKILGDSVFSGCQKLVKIEIPSSVIFVGEDAFKGTSWLRSKASEDFIVVGDGVLVQYNGNAKNIVIPDTVKRIPAYRFATLKTEPESFTIPSTVEYIAKEAFAALVEKQGDSDEESYAYRMRYVKIIGRKGTYAETFANHEYYIFEAID